MQHLFDILFSSGKIGVDLALYKLLPILVIMMSIMNLLEKKGVLRLISIWFSPILMIFGIPGIGIFAIVQILLVSFAAPVTTLNFIDGDCAISNKQISAIFSAILCICQANVSIPLAAFGLNLPICMFTSIICGLIASTFTYYFFSKNIVSEEVVYKYNQHENKIKENNKVITIMIEGAEQGFKLVLKVVPIFILSLFFVELLKYIGIVNILEIIFKPFFSFLKLSPSCLIPILTKYLAGGSAMMSVVITLLNNHQITVLDLNRISGFIINPFDPIGITMYLSAGDRIKKVLTPSIKGALVGIFINGILHLIIF